MRKITTPSINKPESTKGTGTVNTILRYRIRIIAPMVCGGAKSREYDPVSIIRAQSVRGHLRFWWRMLHMQQWPMLHMQQDSKKSVGLFQEESAIFGNAEQSSCLRVFITNLQPDFPEMKPIGEFYCNQNGNKKFRFKENIPDYAAFPYRVQQLKEANESDILKYFPANSNNSIHFTLHIEANLDETQLQQIKNAVQAWVYFGGIGARTRRGFGALAFDANKNNHDVNNADLIIDDIEKFKNNFKQFNLVTTSCNNGNCAWEHGIKKLQEFRQILLPNANTKFPIGIGRNSKKTGKPGMSNWPEAQLTRSMLRDGYKRKDCIVSNDTSIFHSDDQDTNRIQFIDDIFRKRKTGVFPRAAFGLPIKMEMFKHNLIKNGTNKKLESPIQPTIVPYISQKNQKEQDILDRYASPLIIRPVCISGKYYAMACKIPSIPPSGLVLKKSDYDFEENHYYPWNQAVLSPDALNYPNSPIKDYCSDNNAITAFLNYFHSGAAIPKTTSTHTNSSPITVTARCKQNAQNKAITINDHNCQYNGCSVTGEKAAQLAAKLPDNIRQKLQQQGYRLMVTIENKDIVDLKPAP